MVQILCGEEITLIMKLNNVTLVCISSIKIKESLKSLVHCSKLIDFKEVKFITHSESYVNNFDLFHELPNNIKIENCRNLTSSEAYSHFIIFDLHKHIFTDYCLIVQNDGFIVNPNEWTDEFLQYDYIGAPWELKDNDYIDPSNNHIRVGNGGFSLRSRKLLEVSTKEYISFVSITHGTHYKHFDRHYTGEDVNICVHNRSIYEKYGCKFAPYELACKFSVERIVDKELQKSTFGCHARVLS